MGDVDKASPTMSKRSSFGRSSRLVMFAVAVQVVFWRSKCWQASRILVGYLGNCKGLPGAPKVHAGPTLHLFCNLGRRVEAEL